MYKIIYARNSRRLNYTIVLQIT